MSPDIERNFRSANTLYRQSLASGFKNGCVEISLVALGAELTLSDVGSTIRRPTPLHEVVERAGLKIKWMVHANGEAKPEHIKQLFGDEIAIEEGDVAGYLMVHDYPDRIGHSVAIVPDDSSTYNVVDADISGKSLKCSAEALAHAINRVRDNGGGVRIAQIIKCKENGSGEAHPK